MGYRILAALAVLIHFSWILFLVFGAIWGRRHPTVKVLHLAGLAFAFVLHLFSLICPLTHVEIYFRTLADPRAAYSGSFIIHYVDRLIYIALPPVFLLILTIALCIFNLLVYLRRRPRP
jgi:predicted branched-subunit amino acid permease